MKFDPKILSFLLPCEWFCSLIISSSSLLFVHMNATDFYILILYPTTLLIPSLFKFILSLILQDFPCILSCHLQIEIDFFLF